MDGTFKVLVLHITLIGERHAKEGLVFLSEIPPGLTKSLHLLGFFIVEPLNCLFCF